MAHDIPRHTPNNTKQKPYVGLAKKRLTSGSLENIGLLELGEAPTVHGPVGVGLGPQSISSFSWSDEPPVPL